MASHAVAVRRVDAAYKLSASIFVKKYLALHDRGIKNAINRMAKEVKGEAIDAISAGTEEPWNLDRTFEFRNPRGMLLLRPVALAWSEHGARGDKPDPGWPRDDRPFEYAVSPDDADELAKRYRKEPTLFTVRSHRFDAVGGAPQDAKYVRGHTNTSILVPEPGNTFERSTGENSFDSGSLPTLYALVKGPVLGLGEHTKIAESYLASDLWEGITKDTWSIGLPERETLQIKGYVAHARDSTTFAAIRLDLLGNQTLQELAKVHEEAVDAGVTDFDAHPLPFEERLHEDTAAGFLKRLDYLAKWITLCVFDRPFERDSSTARPTVASGKGRKGQGQRGDPEVAKKRPANSAQVEQRLLAEARSKTRGPKRDDRDTEAYASKEFWHQMLAYSEIPGAYKPFEAALSESPFRMLTQLMEKDPNAKFFYNEWAGGIRKQFEEAVKLHNVRDQMPIEAFPYVLPFVDMSKGFVWGSTATPFLLALTAAASCVARHTDTNSKEAQPLEEPQKSGASPDTEPAAHAAGGGAKSTGASEVHSGLNSQRVPKPKQAIETGTLYSIEVTGIEKSHRWFWDNFGGIHYSNRKSLNNGVFAVLFPQSNLFKARYEFNAGLDNKPDVAEYDLKAPIFVKIHGRFPVSLDELSLLGSLYSMLEEVRMRLARDHRGARLTREQMMVPDFDSAKRMKDLLFPYCVAVKGPGERCAASRPLRFV